MKKILFVILLLLSLISSAVTPLYWIGGSGGNLWSNVSNWSLTSGGAPALIIPGASTIAVFDAGSAKPCKVDSNITFECVRLDMVAWNNTITFLGNCGIVVHENIVLGSGVIMLGNHPDGLHNNHLYMDGLAGPSSIDFGGCSPSGVSLYIESTANVTQLSDLLFTGVRDGFEQYGNFDNTGNFALQFAGAILSNDSGGSFGGGATLFPFIIYGAYKDAVFNYFQYTLYWATVGDLSPVTFYITNTTHDTVEIVCNPAISIVGGFILNRTGGGDIYFQNGFETSDFEDLESGEAHTIYFSSLFGGGASYYFDGTFIIGGSPGQLTAIRPDDLGMGFQVYFYFNVTSCSDYLDLDFLNSSLGTSPNWYIGCHSVFTGDVDGIINNDCGSPCIGSTIRSFLIIIGQ